jgi:addiction module HigA family antidote
LIIGIIIEEVSMKRRKPTHPGEVLLEDVIKPLGMTITEAAKDLGISRKMLSEIVNGKGRVGPEIALRIAKATNTSPESWLAMQNKLDLWNAMQNEPKNVIKFEESIAVNQ